jgi:hypothetical protein
MTHFQKLKSQRLKETAENEIGGDYACGGAREERRGEK